MSINGGLFEAADLLVKMNVGDVLVNNAPLSDVPLEKIKGNIVLDTVMTDSDLTITMTEGSVTLTDSSIQGDLAISTTTGNVALNSVITAADSSVRMTNGSVILKGSSIQGDFALVVADAAEWIDNEFKLEDLSI